MSCFALSVEICGAVSDRGNGRRVSGLLCPLKSVGRCQVVGMVDVCLALLCPLKSVGRCQIVGMVDVCLACFVR